MLEHGGNLYSAARHYGIPLSNWLDLSTGINPCGWPIPALPDAAWRRLPEDEDGLEQSAQEYYQCENIIAVAGSQAAIQALPRLRPQSNVAILYPAYAEHAEAWKKAGHRITQVEAPQIGAVIEQCDVLVLLNPGNPSGINFDPRQLRAWHAQLAARSGWLVVDEAFMDPTPENSLASHTAQPGLIVLRSLGKFFGLAGARVGFVCAELALLRALRETLGPWPINNAARQLAQWALQDKSWQAAERLRLKAAAQRLQELLARHQLAPTGGSALFQWVRTKHAPTLHQSLARHGVWVRLFAEPASLRFGLPAYEADWSRLNLALEKSAQ